MSNYEIPNWAGKPPTGLHLDVTKDSKLIQKLMIDEKRCYLFGRNSQLNDFCIDHGSCSRVHAALLHHKHLGRAFLVDLGSTHGTFIGSVRLEGNKPTQLPIDSKFRFGASTRTYIIRERPQAGPRPIMEVLEESSANGEKSGTLLGLPESETELDNLTEFNTAHNRRITMLGISEEPPKKRRKIRLTFKDDEDIINPEDVDPSVGRFRNMVETTIIPKKRSLSTQDHSGSGLSTTKRPAFTSPTKTSASSGLYDGMDSHSSGPSGLFATSLSSKLGIPLPNPAPEVDMAPPSVSLSTSVPQINAGVEGIEDPDQPKKKKYAKEAWPGKKPTPSLLG